MMKIQYIVFTVLLAGYFQCSSQTFPWERPLKMAWSGDGVTFNAPAIFQDSSGVPCIIRWKGDTLICTFQWFRVPVNSPTWDRVAVKFSYDNGQNWTNPSPIVINGLPLNYQRPFDPTLTIFSNDSIRIYFSSSNGIPSGLDSTVNTYSARSHDGINYEFEPGPRVDHPTNKVIDPAVIYFNNAWHYLAPVGSPQQGAYHYISSNGLMFNAVPDIPSDNLHNWTGNYMINSPGELRFYGSSPNFIWYNASSNGGVWNGYVNTNIRGGDPSVLKISNNNYLMVYVGEPYSASSADELPAANQLKIYPCPAADQLQLMPPGAITDFTFRVINAHGDFIVAGTSIRGLINIQNLPAGIYILQLDGESSSAFWFIKL